MITYIINRKMDFEGLTIWKNISGYFKYEVSICGQVRNLLSKRILKPVIDSYGYYMVTLYEDGTKINHKIHRLVASEFILNTELKIGVEHINNNSLDNTVSNLRWTENPEYGFNDTLLSNSSESEIRGISWNKEVNKWLVHITIDGVNKYFGYCDDLEEAKIIRSNKALDLLKEFINSCEI